MQVKWVLWKVTLDPKSQGVVPTVVARAPACVAVRMALRAWALDPGETQVTVSTRRLSASPLHCFPPSQAFSQKLPLAGMPSWMSSSFLLDFDAASVYSLVSFSSKIAVQFLEFSSVPASAITSVDQWYRKNFGNVSSQQNPSITILGSITWRTWNLHDCHMS